jgi:hypothetical protein
MKKEWLKGEINWERRGAKDLRQGNRGKFITLDVMKRRHLINGGMREVGDLERV